MTRPRRPPVAAGVEHGARSAAPARAFAFGVAILLASATAMAEKADRDQPVRLEADKVTIDDAKQIAVFEGNVVLRQGTLVIRGDRMEVRQDKEGFRYGTTWGNRAYFRQKRDGVDEHIEGWAERLEYDGRAETMKMFSRAQVKRGQDDVRGNFISYDAKSEFYQVIGGGKAAADARNTEGRVRAIIQPKSRKQPPPNPPLQLKESGGLGPEREESQARNQ